MLPDTFLFIFMSSYSSAVGVTHPNVFPDESVGAQMGAGWGGGGGGLGTSVKRN